MKSLIYIIFKHIVCRLQLLTFVNAFLIVMLKGVKQAEEKKYTADKPFYTSNKNNKQS